MITILRLLLVRGLAAPKWVLSSVPRASIFFFALGYLMGNGYIKTPELDSIVKKVVTEIQDKLE